MAHWKKNENLQCIINQALTTELESDLSPLLTYHPYAWVAVWLHPPHMLRYGAELINKRTAVSLNQTYFLVENTQTMGAFGNHCIAVTIISINPYAVCPQQLTVWSNIKSIQHLGDIHKLQCISKSLWHPYRAIQLHEQMSVKYQHHEHG